MEEKMTDVKKIQNERTQIFHDVFDNKIPKRVPINISLSLNAVAEYAGIHGKEALWHPRVLEKAANELCRLIPSDICIFGMQLLVPSKYQALGANGMEVSSTGFMQHPNHVGFFPEDYEAFIEDPYACIIERVLPRNFRALDFNNNPGRAMMSIYQAATGAAATVAENRELIRKLNEKYGFFPGDGRTGCYAPLDILTDTLRSLSGMVMDIRRMPDKVQAAVEAVYPLNYKVGLPRRLIIISRYFSRCILPHLSKRRILYRFGGNLGCVRFKTMPPWGCTPVLSVSKTGCATWIISPSYPQIRGFNLRMGIPRLLKKSLARSLLFPVFSR
jgi:hypothetical protein